MSEELCKHDNVPAHCSICLGKTKPTATRTSSTVSKDRFLVCPICGRDQPETRFPTDKNKVRRTDMCRECEQYLRAQRKQGVDRETAIDKQRRRYPKAAE